MIHNGAEVEVLKYYCALYLFKYYITESRKTLPMDIMCVNTYLHNSSDRLPSNTTSENNIITNTHVKLCQHDNLYYNIRVYNVHRLYECITLFAIINNNNII